MGVEKGVGRGGVSVTVGEGVSVGGGIGVTCPTETEVLVGRQTTWGYSQIRLLSPARVRQLQSKSRDKIRIGRRVFIGMVVTVQLLRLWSPPHSNRRKAALNVNLL